MPLPDFNTAPRRGRRSRRGGLAGINLGLDRKGSRRGSAFDRLLNPGGKRGRRTSNDLLTAFGRAFAGAASIFSFLNRPDPAYHPRFDHEPGDDDEDRDE